MKISYISLGCAKNQVDFEFLIGELSAYGFEIELDPAKCDAVIINTCGFIESAVNEAIENILSISDIIADDAKLIVTGCMVERYMEEIKIEMPEVDFVTGVHKLSEVTTYLKKIANINKNIKKPTRVITNHPYFAYVKISEGCDNKCSFCTIPSIRGKLQSRNMNDIEDEVFSLIKGGAKEIILISQDTTKYHYDIDKSVKLIELLETLTDRFPTIFFRLLYLNPEGVSDKLIKFIASRENIVKYFDIPMQHASDNILKLMKRRSNKAMLDKVIENIKKHIPEAIIRSTFIVGFPNESEEDFNQLKLFLVEKRLDFVGFFEYSDEDGTKSFDMENKVSKSVAIKRRESLEKIQKRITTDRLKLFKGKKFICFIEGESADIPLLLEGRALFQSPDIDGKLYVTDGIADKGFGPYDCFLDKVVFPDIFVKLI